MPMLGDPVWLQVPLRRVRCDNCGARVERVSWLDRHARMTRRLADFVALWCEKLAVAHVCKLSGLHWETVRKIDRQRVDAKGVGQGVVAWDVEVTNQTGELVASYDILTLVAKRG